MAELSALAPVCLITIGCICCFRLSAQTQYTLQQILSIADKNGTRMKIIENEAQVEKQQTRTYLSEALPKIDFSASVAYDNQTQRGTQLSSTTDILAIFDRLDGLLFNWSVSLQQPVFSFGKVYNSLKLVSLSKDVLEQNRLLQRNLFFVQVIEQYTKCYISQFDHTIAAGSLKRSRHILEKTNLDFQYEQASRLEFLRTKSAVEGNFADSIRTGNDEKTTRQKLNVMIGLPDTCEYTLILDTVNRYPELPEMTSSGNWEITLKKLETEVNKRLRRNAWASLWPSLSLTASIANEFFTVDTTGLTGVYLAYLEANGGQTPVAPAVLFPENPGPGEFFNPDFFNYSIGVLLNWNIFDGTRSWASHRQAVLKEEKSKLELEQLKLENSNTLRELNGQLQSLAGSIEGYRFQYEASQKALEQAEMDINDGFIDAVTWLEIDQEYRNAARKLDDAKLQKLILQAKLQVASGLPVYEND